MKKIAWVTGSCCALLAAIVTGTIYYASHTRHLTDKDVVACVLTHYCADGNHPTLALHYPKDGTLFPPESIPPTFRWDDKDNGANTWLVQTCLTGEAVPYEDLCRECRWTPTTKQWQVIKRHSQDQAAEVTIIGFDGEDPQVVLSATSVAISTSNDEVGAPIFYRDVNLPFIDAVTDPTRIRWRFGDIASTDTPRVVLEKLPVCGNCHSFSADGSLLGMDVDYANDRGSYAITPVSRNIVLDKQKIITWADFHREDGTLTFGLLSQVSPDGRYIVSTVKDQSVFVPKPGLAFSQLFFPIQGVLVVYDRQTETFQSLPGADDPQFVQSNPTWSPDGKYIVFARNEAYQLKNAGPRTSPLLTPQECTEFLEEGKTFLYDLYRIPFNEGRGGKAEPLAGASHNGKSNYFARYSPDGKWIVYCQASSYMLLQPDSQLYIIPAEGGEARKLKCNTTRMNSWHSWSPNSKWLVFSSKLNSAYTQLFLTHIDNAGLSTPPMELSQFTIPNRACNIPEFVNTDSGAIGAISEQFVDDYSFARAGSESLKYGERELAERMLRKAVAANPENANAHNNLGTILAEKGDLREAETHFIQALQNDPTERNARRNLAAILIQRGEIDQAIECYREGLAASPQSAPANLDLAITLLKLGKMDEAFEYFSAAARLAPENASAHFYLGAVAQGRSDNVTAVKEYAAAVDCQPDHVPAITGLASIRVLSQDPKLRNLDQGLSLAEKAAALTEYQDPSVLDMLARVYTVVGRTSDAIRVATQALHIAQSRGNAQLANHIEQQLQTLQGRPGFSQ